MAAFSYQHPPFLLDSIILPNTPIKIPGFLQKGDINTTCFSHYPSEPIHQVPIEAGVPKESYVDNSRHVSDEPSSMVLKWNQDFSSVGIEPKSGDQVTQEKTQMDKKRRSRNAPCLISALSKDASQGEVKKQKKCNSILKDTEKKQLKADKKNEKKVTEGVPTDYIHVRARRGQATDSHSLAERVRREKISVRMKLLQDLVPGCDKVTSKAHMLDEIINYVQSLQNQVEFLSMKLASVHPMFHEYGVDLDAFMKLRSWASPSLSLQVSIPTQPTVSVDDPTTLATKSNYPIMDSSVVRLVQQGQRPNAFCQNNENPLWGAEDQILRFINQSGYNNFNSFQ